MAATIFALSTPPGKSGVAVVRVSGPQAWSILAKLIQDQDTPEARVLTVRALYDPDSRHMIDQAMIAGFKAPHSFTGEDLVEYHLHGSLAVIKSLTQVLSSFSDCRMAEPGEFTRRAFDNGKMDLTEAEAIGDLIHAETELQRSQALTQMNGVLFRLYDQWTKTLSEILAHAEAVIDFPDEDVPDDDIKKLAPGIQGLIGSINAHMADNRWGERVRSGIEIVILGAPNAGKSTLINALTRRDVAIVSGEAGTTRDIIDVQLDWQGYPIILSDTAGLRDDLDADDHQESIEKEGINRALSKAKASTIRLLLLDGSILADTKQPDSYTQNIIALESDDSKIVIAINKSDLMKENSLPEWIEAYKPVFISAKENQGLGDLRTKVIETIEAMKVAHDTPYITRARHREALENSLGAMQRALTAELPELTLEDLRLALRELGRITGQVDIEDLLDIIFKDFCIGK